MSDTRRKDANWTICSDTDGPQISFDGAQLAVLMDLRDELKLLNRLLRCENFLAIPKILRDLERNTRKRKKLKIVTKRNGPAA